jgi:hypothetical protein
MRAAVALASGIALATLATLARRAGAQELSELGSVSQKVSGTTITGEYSRPVERGRRAVFGDLVKWGQLWTPGANWATTLDVDRDIRVEGKLLPKGKYSVWAVPAPNTWTISLHRRARRFHVDRPDSTDEQLRVVVRPVAQRRDFVIIPVGEDQFTRWRRAADGAFWCEANIFVSFDTANGRATGFEVESADGGVISRATRIP